MNKVISFFREVADFLRSMPMERPDVDRATLARERIYEK